MSAACRHALVLVYSPRGATYVHRERDLALLTAALRPDGIEETDAVDRIAEAMTQVIDIATAVRSGRVTVGP